VNEVYRASALQARFCGLTDAGSDTVNITLDFSVGEPQSEQAVLIKNGVAFGIVFCLTMMYGSIYFDDYLGGVAIEVRDEALNYLLTMKMQPRQPTSPQMSPKQAFGRRHFPSQSLCRFSLDPFVMGSYD
jgi:hypothetical protein